MTKPAKEEEIDLNIDEEDIMVAPVGPFTPAWYEADEHYRPFCEADENESADDVDAYASETDPEESPETV